MKNNPEAKLFFANKALNAIVLIKDVVSEADLWMVGSSGVVDQVVFFNEQDIAKVAAPSFARQGIQSVVVLTHCGEGAVTASPKDTGTLRIVVNFLDPFDEGCFLAG